MKGDTAQCDICKKPFVKKSKVHVTCSVECRDIKNARIKAYFDSKDATERSLIYSNKDVINYDEPTPDEPNWLMKIPWRIFADYTIHPEVVKVLETHHKWLH